MVHPIHSGLCPCLKCGNKPEAYVTRVGLTNKKNKRNYTVDNDSSPRTQTRPHKTRDTEELLERVFRSKYEVKDKCVRFHKFCCTVDVDISFRFNELLQQ